MVEETLAVDQQDGEKQEEHPNLTDKSNEKESVQAQSTVCCSSEDQNIEAMKKLQSKAAQKEKLERIEAEKARHVEFAWAFTQACSEYERSPEDYHGDKIYIVSSRWLSSMKAYIKYDKIRSGSWSGGQLSCEKDLYNLFFLEKQEQTTTSTTNSSQIQSNSTSTSTSWKAAHPGRVLNKPLLKPFEKYLRVEKVNDESNYVLRSKLETRDQHLYALMSEEAWELVKDEFGCDFELQRGKDPNARSYFGPVFKIFARDYFRVLLIPPLSQLTQENIDQFVKVRKVYYEERMSLYQLKTKIAESITHSPLFNKHAFKVTNLRLWKPDFQYQSPERLIRFIKEQDFERYFESKKISLYDKENTPNQAQKSEQTPSDAASLTSFDSTMDEEDDWIEENSGVPFPGTQLDFWLQDSLKELQNSQNRINPNGELLFVELGLPFDKITDTSHFIFKYDTFAGRQGDCSNCSEKNLLRITCPCAQASYCSQRCQHRHKRFHMTECEFMNTVRVSKKDKFYTVASMAARGIVGLQNLGNSCYMNSALQCLSAVQVLREFFLSMQFLKELNEENVLGSKGQIAMAYAQLVYQIWNAPKQTSCVYPHQFKRTLARFNLMYKGEIQQDSPEFLAYLLDMLHEDLNRVKNKKYVSIPDLKGSDEQVSNTYWQMHLQRNQSIIVDLFTGQFKSTVMCPKCHSKKVTFDPFSMVQLPIPQKASIQFYFMSCHILDMVFLSEIVMKSGQEEESFMQTKQRIAVHASEYYKRDIQAYDFVIGVVSRDKMKILCLFDEYETQTSRALTVNPHLEMLFAFEINHKALKPGYKDGLPSILQGKKPRFAQKGVYKKSFSENPDEIQNFVSTIANTSNKKQQFEDELFERCVPEVKSLTELTNSGWIQVPISLAKKQSQFQNTIQHAYNQKPTENVSEVVQLSPRLMWLNLDWSMAKVHKQIVKPLLPALYQAGSEQLIPSYTQMFGSHVSEQNSQSFHNSDDSYQQMHSQFAMKDSDWQNVASTHLPMVVRVVNTHADRNYAKNLQCRLCGSFECENCPLVPPDQTLTLREYLQDVCRTDKHLRNEKLFAHNQDVDNLGKFSADSEEEDITSEQGHHQNNEFDMEVVEEEEDFKKEINDKAEEDATKKAEEQAKEIADQEILGNIEQKIKHLPKRLNSFLQFNSSRSRHRSNSREVESQNNNSFVANNEPFKPCGVVDNTFEEQSEKSSTHHSHIETNSLLAKKRSGRHKVFQLQVVFIMDNLESEENRQQINDLIMFTPHPRRLQIPSSKNNNSQGQNQYSSQAAGVSSGALEESKNNGGGTNCHTLSSCFKQFRRAERLSQLDSWYCNRCQSHEQAIKHIEMYKAGPILVLCLNRFKSHNLAFNEKINEKIDFPITGLDLTQQVTIERHKMKSSEASKSSSQQESSQQQQQPLLYDLIAVINHYGTMHFGHYDSFAKNSETGKWYHFNDSVVSEIQDPENNIATEASYVLFYQKREFKPLLKEEKEHSIVNFEAIKQTALVKELTIEQLKTGQNKMKMEKPTKLSLFAHLKTGQTPIQYPISPLTPPSKSPSVQFETENDAEIARQLTSQYESEMGSHENLLKALSLSKQEFLKNSLGNKKGQLAKINTQAIKETAIKTSLNSKAPPPKIQSALIKQTSHKKSQQENEAMLKAYESFASVSSDQEESLTIEEGPTESDEND